MAFLAAPTIPASPTAPQAAAVLLIELLPVALVLTNQFLPAPAFAGTAANDSAVGYAL